MLSKVIKNKSLRNYSSNVIILTIEKILRIVLGFFVGVLVARYLGPEQFGLFSYVQSFAGMFVAFSILGLDSIVVRELVSGKYNLNTLLGTSFILKLLGSIFIMVVLWIVLYLIDTDSYTKALIFIISFGYVIQSFNVIDYYFQSKVTSKYVAYSNIIALVISNVIKIILITYNAPLEYFVGVILLDNIIVAVCFIYYYKQNGLNISLWKVEVNVAKDLLREALPIIISVLAFTISMKIDQIIVKELLDEKSLGFYAVSLRMVEVFYFIPLILTQTFFPSVVSSYKTNRKMYDLKVKSLGLILILISLGISLILFFSSNYIILTFFGNAYQDSANLLLIHSMVLIFVSYITLRKKILYIEMKSKLVMYYSLCTVFIMSTSTVVFIKLFGLIGAPIAYLFTMAISVLVIPMFFGRFKDEVLLFFKSFNIVNLFNLLKIIKNKKEY